MLCDKLTFLSQLLSRRLYNKTLMSACVSSLAELLHL